MEQGKVYGEESSPVPESLLGTLKIGRRESETKRGDTETENRRNSSAPRQSVSVHIVDINVRVHSEQEIICKFGCITEKQGGNEDMSYHA